MKQRRRMLTAHEAAPYWEAAPKKNPMTLAEHKEWAKRLNLIHDPRERKP